MVLQVSIASQRGATTRQVPPRAPSATQVLDPLAVTQVLPVAQRLVTLAGSQAAPTATAARHRDAVEVAEPLHARPPAVGTGYTKRS